jgi:hypothetical protein
MIAKLKFPDCKNQHFFTHMRCLVLLILLFSFKLEGQYRFDFEIDSTGLEECCLDGRWFQVPAERWCCDTQAPITGSSSLHHSFDNSQEGCDYLIFRHDPLHTGDPFSFTFRIKHGFPPSSMNNWQLATGAVFDDGSLSADGEARILSGLVAGVNFTGSDDFVKIWWVDQGKAEVLCSTSLNYQEAVAADQAPLFRIEGDGAGNLDLYWSPDPEEQTLEHLCRCRMDGDPWGRELVLRYRYTSSRDRGLWLDELMLEGSFVADTSAPELQEVDLADPNTLVLEFSERVVLTGESSFVLYPEEQQGGLLPEEILQLGNAVQLSFSEVIPNRVAHQLSIEGIADLDGNRMAATLVDVLRNEAQWGDVVFNEIMADPDPPVRLEKEYLELYNRSDYPVDPEGWCLKVNAHSYFLDASYVLELSGTETDGKGSIGVLLPGSYLCLQGITLPNDGATLSLFSGEGTLVHASTYGIPWEGPEWKKEGGWSLESPDADLICRVSSLWEYSGDAKGGTPGRPNSNRTSMVDVEPPVWLYAGSGDPGELLLHFNEPLSHSGDGYAGIRLNPGAVVPDSVRLLDPLRDIFYMKFPEDFQQWPGYRLSLTEFSDCAGNRTDVQEFSAGAIEAPAPGMVVINEIMYDPWEGNPEYVELFVNGDSFLDLQDLAIQLDGEGERSGHPLALSSHSRIIGPGQYLVLTDCVPHLREAYGLEVSGQWVELSEMHALDNNSGSVSLTDRAGQVLDRVPYSDEMHMELLDDPKGISLERVSAARAGTDPENWHSAASMADHATPGKENSQSLGEMPAEDLLKVAPEVFSPDNDGFEDLLSITIHCGGNDWVIGLYITDLHGNRLRILANNHLAAPSVTYTWDGEDEGGSMLPMGFYVIHARGYRSATGEQWIRRKAVGLVYR